MSTQQNTGLPALELDEKAVVSYLRKHPDFFENHLELLEDMRLTHPSGGAISLIERQVAVLREKNHQIRRQLQGLLQIARDNDRLNESIQQLTLGLMRCRSLSQVVDTLDTQLTGKFRSDVVTLWVFDPRLTPDQPATKTTTVRQMPEHDEAVASFKSMLQKGKPVCGKLRKDQLQLLFGDGSANVGSAAIIPLTDNTSTSKRRLGLVAVGSSDSERFNPSMGTLFLSFLGQAIACSLRNLAPKA